MVTLNLEAAYNQAKAALDNAGGWSPPSGGGDYSSVDAAATALTNAQSDLGAAKIKYQDKYTVFENIAKAQLTSQYTLDAYKKALYQEYKDDTGKVNPEDPYTKKILQKPMPPSRMLRPR